jgi:hypothetical protein
VSGRINVPTEAQSWRSVLRRVHAELTVSIAAIDPGSPSIRAQLEQAQRAMSAVQHTFQQRNLDRLLSRDKPHPRTAAEAKSVLLRLLQSRRRHRRTRRVRCPEKE